MKSCDNHPDRPVVREIGYDTVDGGQAPIFKVTMRLCQECYDWWKKHNVAFERCP